MLVGNRAGSVVEVVSIRVQTTELAPAFEFSEMNTRPVPVAAHNVLTSVATRSIAATAPPARVPYAALLRSVAPGGPICTKSPQAGFAADVVNSGQFASR